MTFNKISHVEKEFIHQRTKLVTNLTQGKHILSKVVPFYFMNLTKMD